MMIYTYNKRERSQLAASAANVCPQFAYKYILAKSLKEPQDV